MGNRITRRIPRSCHLIKLTSIITRFTSKPILLVTGILLKNGYSIVAGTAEKEILVGINSCINA